jgi:hypothetical protein
VTGELEVETQPGNASTPRLAAADCARNCLRVFFIWQTG